MIPIAISQRVTIIPGREERRDSLDQKWMDFLRLCGLSPVIIPNNVDSANAALEHTAVKGVLLTGGDDLVSYGGDAPERDATERFLLRYCLDRKLPLLGVCRGMQLLQDHFGVKLTKVAGHAATSHSIEMDGQQVSVNSFHNFAALESTADLEVKARSDDGVIEAVSHKYFPAQGIMWHPERNGPFQESDINFFMAFFHTEV